MIENLKDEEKNPDVLWGNDIDEDAVRKKL